MDQCKETDIPAPWKCNKCAHCLRLLDEARKRHYSEICKLHFRICELENELEAIKIVTKPSSVDAPEESYRPDMYEMPTC